MDGWIPWRTLWKRFAFLPRAAVATTPLLAITIYLYVESRNSERLLLVAETARQADAALAQFQGFVSARVDALKDAGNFLLADVGTDADQEFARYLRRVSTDLPYFESFERLDAEGRRISLLQVGGSHAAPPGTPQAAAVLSKAFASHAPAASGSFDLPDGERAVTIIVPVLRDDRPEGALAGTIRLSAAIRDLYGADGPDLWNLELSDRAGRVVYEAADGEKVPSGYVATRFVPLGDRAWKLYVWPTAALANSLRTAAPQRILIIGLLATLVVGIANFLLSQREERLAESLRESERLAADRAAARRRLSELINGIEAVIWESDAQRQRVTFVNDYARKLLGLDAGRWEADPDSWIQRVHPDDRAGATENLRAAQRPGQTSAAEYRMLDAEGRIIWVREIITVIGGEDGRVLGRRGVVVDISARVQAEEALRQSQKLESLGVLAGGIAHDFNNLLTTILGNAEMLRPRLAGDARGRTQLEKIERTTRRLAELTRQMLAYSGRGEFTVAEVDLNAIVTEMTELLTVSTPKNVVVVYRLDPALPLIRADAAQMRQVILNLLTNATEAIGEHSRGEVVIRTEVATLEDTQIESSFAGQELEPGRYVTLEVADTGSGMSPETLSKIFDPFFTTKFTGRGLGLAALRGIIRSHRGGIRIFSRLGEGTVFTLVFPAVGPHRDVSNSGGDRLPEAAELAGRTILLVDDEESLRSLMAAALEDAGCRVIQASDGEEGIAEFRRHCERIDLTVLDLTMPRLNGDEVFRQIMDTRPDAKVILISGYTREDVAGHFTGQRVTGYLEKPFPPSELIAKIRAGLLADGTSPDAASAFAFGRQSNDTPASPSIRPVTRNEPT